MGKFRKKPVVIEAITFEELVQYGKDNGANIVEGMPWSFEYKGQPITHENDECYLIPTKEGTMNFTPQDVLITGVQGEIYPCKKDIFEATYDKESVKSEGLNFGQALEALKAGKLVARIGWNGKGMFVFKQIPNTVEKEIIPKMISFPDNAKKALLDREQSVSFKSVMLIINSEGQANSWVPSSSDCFAEDWIILE